MNQNVIWTEFGALRQPAVWQFTVWSYYSAKSIKYPHYNTQSIMLGEMPQSLEWAWLRFRRLVTPNSICSLDIYSALLIDNHTCVKRAKR